MVIDVELEPMKFDGEVFTKPIIILTSDWSASATEIFVLAMKELPYVTVIGNRTEGILPTSRDRVLQGREYRQRRVVLRTERR